MFCKRNFTAVHLSSFCSIIYLDSKYPTVFSGPAVLAAYRRAAETLFSLQPSRSFWPSMARDIHENGQCHGRHRQINRKLLSVIQCCMLDNLFLSFQSLLHTDLMLAHYFFVNSLTHSAVVWIMAFIHQFIYFWRAQKTPNTGLV